MTEEDSQHLQNINLREAQVIFFEFVKQVIFTYHEFRTLQSLLYDYIRITSNYGHDSNIKSNYIKQMLVKEFGDCIAFYQCSLDSLTKEQEDVFEHGVFARSMTANLYSCVVLELWIESTINKGSKLKNGLLAILKKETGWIQCKKFE